MGGVQSVQKPATAGPTVEGEWKNRFSTGYQYVTPDIISGPGVTNRKTKRTHPNKCI